MGRLDEPATLGVDRQGLIAKAGEAAGWLDAARAAARALELPFPAQAVREVAVCGMGGSAIAGDLVAGAYAERLRRPLAVVRDYYLPGWVGEDTLVVLSSYSGDTEETLTCAMQALERGSLAVAVTSGGKLAGFYGAQGVPVVPVPGDLGVPPRAALIHLLVPLLVLLERLEVLPSLDAELEEARATLAATPALYGPDVPEERNPAKQLAAALEGAVPLVYGAEATAAVALRWKCQFNENAKLPSFWAALPEQNHNEIVGFDGGGAVGQRLHLVLLRDPRQHRQVQRRFDLVRELTARHVRGTTAITAEGEGTLARVLDLVLLGDYASLYLACLLGVDPAPVDVIERLKDRLATAGFGRTATPGG
jgi:glucose/mannose-6-phosphate isomerase